MIENTYPTLEELTARFKRVLLLTLVGLLVTAPIAILSQTATAAQVTSRSLLISTAQAAATANYTFTFTPGSTTQIQSLKFEACTTALGTCTAPAGLNLSGGTHSNSGFQGATAFTKDTTTAGAGCTTVSNLCLTRTDTTSQTLTAHTVTDTGAVNQNATNCSAAANCTFFVRITSYSDAAWATPVDNGTVASSTTQQFTVNASIQEVLSFCIGATTIDDGTSASPASCASISGTSLSLGILNPSNVSVSPVSTGTNGGDNNNGIAHLSTNASNGASVTYGAIQQSGTNHAGTLRVAGSTCNAGNVNTDQCINAVGTTKSTLTAGTERYGMTVASVLCPTSAPAYTCSFGAGTYNLARDTNYNGTGANTYPTDSNLITGTSNASYAWDESGTFSTIASSASSAIKVVDRESLILKFAATPNLVSPTGSYTARADFVAVPTF